MNAIATVSQLHPTTTLTDDQIQAVLLRDGASRAVFRVIDILEADLKRAKNDWKEKRSDATKAYREHLRDDEREVLRGAGDKLKSKEKLTDRDKQNLIAIVEHYYAACDGLGEHDEILADGKTDKDARKKRIAQFKAAHRELMLQGKDGNPNQQKMFEPPSAVGGMTEDTKEVVYSALLQLDKDGAALDDVQRSLLTELGSAGVKVVELNVNAAAAIEQEVADEDDDEDSEEDDEDGETEIPFQ
jgi:hypothetical protein